MRDEEIKKQYNEVSINKKGGNRNQTYIKINVLSGDL